MDKTKVEQISLLMEKTVIDFYSFARQEVGKSNLSLAQYYEHLSPSQEKKMVDGMQLFISAFDKTRNQYKDF
jgi:hypothetical protein